MAEVTWMTGKLRELNIKLGDNKRGGEPEQKQTEWEGHQQRTSLGGQGQQDFGTEDLGQQCPSCFNDAKVGVNFKKSN